MEYKEIRAVYSKDTVCVYQAYSHNLANEVAKSGKFGKYFNMDRMTWIKPSFLWMMYRCGWATKEKQERVLRIYIKRNAFDYIVKNAVPSSYSKDMNVSFEEWKKLVKNSEIRVQWDPERDIFGNPLNYRSIQLGIRGNAVKSYVNDWIVKIEDITEYVKDLNYKKENNIDITNLLPKEKIYTIE